MYALDVSQRAAWKTLFQLAGRLSPSLALPDKIIFSDNAELTLNPAASVAHTCGYPLMTQYKGQLRPLCVPCFNIDGCEEGQYYSLFLVHHSDEAHHLADCEGYKSGINHQNSNSGMNVFRAAVAKIKPAKGAIQAFFKSVDITGSHLNSVAAIARGEIDIASIDAISYHFISRFKPELCKNLRSIGRSESTMGLPFVTQIAAPDLSGETLAEALNQALSLFPRETSALDLKGFKAVTLEDYQPILALEQFAIDKAYPALI